MSLLTRIAKAETSIIIPGGMALPEKAKPTVEIGVSGLQRTKGVGYVFEEWLAQLSTHRQRQVYREMRDNDAVIGAMAFGIEMLLRRASWSVEAGKANKQGEAQAQFVRECMDDMSHTWADLISEIVSMFWFGFSLFETVYKKREGPTGTKTSKYNDGLIGWRKIAPRAQESILYWIWDDEGGLQGFVQLAAPDYRTTAIPIERGLLFRTTSIKNNPEGRSVLRNCFQNWFEKRRLREVQGIGAERDLCGLPIIYATAEAQRAAGGGDANVGQTRLEKIVRNIRMDDQMGIVLPMVVDEKGNQSIKVELLHSGGSKQIDTRAFVQDLNHEMYNTMMMGFIELGQTEHGARSLHMSATQLFGTAIAASMDSVADVMNRIAIPRLLAMNGMDLELAPKLVPGEIGGRDLEELGNFVLKLSQSGVNFTDPDTVAVFRKKANLPEDPGDSVAVRTEDLEDTTDDEPNADNPDDQQAQERLQNVA